MASRPPAAPIPAQKRALRQQMRARREALSPTERAAAAAAATERLLALPELARARVVSAYFPTRGELDVLAAVRLGGRRAVFPRVGKASPRLRFCAVAPETRLVPGAYGILEPGPEVPEVALEEIDVFLVPGLAFDACARRLGYGGGYYDEVAARLRAAGRGFLVGVGFDFQIVEDCPAVDGDVALDCIVTDARVMRCAPDGSSS